MENKLQALHAAEVNDAITNQEKKTVLDYRHPPINTSERS